MQEPTYVDVFCGAGGLGIGLEQVGFKGLASIDADKDSTETLKTYSNHEVISASVSEFITEIENGKRKYPNLDLLVGGPPCQGFCSINPTRHENDPRNSLVDAFLHVANLLQPKAILIENVTGLLSLAKGFAITKIEHRLRALGYNVSYKVLQAAHYGVPQSRWRLFVVGSKSENFSFPSPSHLAHVVPNFIRGKELTFACPSPTLFTNYLEKTSVWEAISDLPDLKNGGGSTVGKYNKKSETDYQLARRSLSKSLLNHQTKTLQTVNMKRVEALPLPGMNWTDLPIELMPKNLQKMQKKYKGGVGAKTRFRRLKKDGLFSTIVTSPDPYWGAFIHPTQDRVISVREAARAQSFDDDIKFLGPLNSQYRQIGNAVPPLLAAAVAKQLLEVI